MKNKEQLINNIIGQLNGVNRMIEEERPCQQVLVQIKAVKSAINSLTNKIIEDSSKSCLEKINKKERDELKILLNEMIKSN